MKDKIMYVLFIILVGLVVYLAWNSEKKEREWKSNTVAHINNLYERIGGMIAKPLLIPEYCEQTNFIVSPDKTAYIPCVYNKNGEFTKLIEDAPNLFWLDNKLDGKKRYYFDMRKIVNVEK